MVRLAVCGVNETLCDDIARRVWGGHIVGQVSYLSDSQPLTDRLKTCPTLFDTFDAVAYIGPRTPDPAEMDQVINAGKHLLLATDTILSVDGLDALVDRGASTGARVVVMNPERFFPSRRVIQDELRGPKSGLPGPRFGVPGLIRIHRWEAACANGTLDTSDTSTLPAPLVRDLDLVLWLTRRSPNLVYAVRRCGGESADDATGTIQVHLGFSDGGMALIDHADSLPPGDGYQSLSVICSNGAMYSDDHSNRQLAFRGGSPQAVATDEGVLPLVNLIQQFVDGLTLTNANQSGLAQWRQVRRLAGTVRRSLDAGRAVSPEEC